MLKKKWYHSEIIQLHFVLSFNFINLMYGTAMNIVKNLHIIICAVILELCFMLFCVLTGQCSNFGLLVLCIP
jgi:hypothetical protein